MGFSEIVAGAFTGTSSGAGPYEKVCLQTSWQTFNEQECKENQKL